MRILDAGKVYAGHEARKARSGRQRDQDSSVLTPALACATMNAGRSVSALSKME